MKSLCILVPICWWLRRLLIAAVADDAPHGVTSATAARASISEVEVIAFFRPGVVYLDYFWLLPAAC
jgi:hypothetical protein